MHQQPTVDASVETPSNHTISRTSGPTLPRFGSSWRNLSQGFGWGVVATLVGGLLFASGIAWQQHRALQSIPQPASPAPASSSNSKLSEVMALGSTSGSVADVVEMAGKSIVTVAVKSQQPVYENMTPPGMLGLNIRVPSGKVQEVQRDIGTGFVIDQGLVVTNRHVVASPTASYTIIDSENQEHEVINVYRDPVNDLAILQVKGLNVSALPLGDSEKIRVGDGAIAIGTALGEFRNTVTTGVVSGKGRGIQASAGSPATTEELLDVIQTDAAINPGNSGGPLISYQGEVMGVNVATTTGADSISFAIPINVVKESLSNFNQTGKFDRASLGVSYRMVPHQFALLNRLPEGAFVEAVSPGSAGQKAGILPGDIIAKIDGVPLNGQTLTKVLNTKKPDATITVTIWRSGEEKELLIPLNPAAH